ADGIFPGLLSTQHAAHGTRDGGIGARPGRARGPHRGRPNLTPASPACEDDPSRRPEGAHVADRLRALVTAPFRGEGMETLRSLADVVYDPWIEQVPLRLYNGETLAARIEAEGATLLI